MLFGESAGSASVANQMILSRSQGLFAHAGMESGPPSDWSSKSLDLAAEQFQHLLSNSNCTDTSVTEVVNCLRLLLAETVIDIFNTLPDGFVNWSPVADGVEINGSTQELWRLGKINQVQSVLIGTNRDEGTIFLKIPTDINATGFSGYVLEQFGEDLGSKVLELYPLSNYTSPWFAASAIFADSLMQCPSRRAAYWLLNLDIPIPAYRYYFTHEIEMIRLLKPTNGVSHASELPFVFHTLPALWNSADVAMSDVFVNYWTTFARTGSPGFGNINTTWPTYDNVSKLYLDIDSPSCMIMSDLRPLQCDLWDRVYLAGCHINNCPCTCEL